MKFHSSTYTCTKHENRLMKDNYLHDEIMHLSNIIFKKPYTIQFRTYDVSHLEY